MPFLSLLHPLCIENWRQKSLTPDRSGEWTQRLREREDSRVQRLSWSFLLMYIESVMPSNYLILCRPLLLLLSIFPSIRVFSKKSVLHIRWPKYWSFSFSLSPPNEYSGLIFFRMDWLDLAVQGTLKSLLQHCSLRPSRIWVCEAILSS